MIRKEELMLRIIELETITFQMEDDIQELKEEVKKLKKGKK